MTDNPSVSYGWCAPSSVFLDILNGVPPSEPVPECVEHRWIRRILSPACQCALCEDDTQNCLECDECCEWWYPDGTDHGEWQKVWDSLE